MKTTKGFKYLGVLGWFNDNNEPMFCYKAYHSCQELRNGDRIKQEAAESEELEEAISDYVEFEISFTRGGEMQEVHLLSYAEVGEDGIADCALVGEEIKDENGKIVGHTLLTNDEFKALTAMARRTYKREKNHWDWDDYDLDGCDWI